MRSERPAGCACRQGPTHWRSVSHRTMTTTFLDYDRRLREDVYADWPVIAQPLGWSDMCLGWQMEYYERTALISVVSGLHPDEAIEVGTASGGSLAVMARFARHVHTLDIKAESGQLLAGRFP